LPDYHGPSQAGSGQSYPVRDEPETLGGRMMQVNDVSGAAS
jgi:hypothetical protein